VLEHPGDPRLPDEARADAPQGVAIAPGRQVEGRRRRDDRGARGVRRLRHLERHVAAEHDVARSIDDPHAALPDGDEVDVSNGVERR
jgi:hypothetical protein